MLYLENNKETQSALRNLGVYFHTARRDQLLAVPLVDRKRRIEEGVQRRLKHIHGWGGAHVDVELVDEYVRVHLTQSFFSDDCVMATIQPGGGSVLDWTLETAGGLKLRWTPPDPAFGDAVSWASEEAAFGPLSEEVVPEIPADLAAKAKFFVRGEIQERILGGSRFATIALRDGRRPRIQLVDTAMGQARIVRGTRVTEIVADHNGKVSFRHLRAETARGGAVVWVEEGKSWNGDTTKVAPPVRFRNAARAAIEAAKRIAAKEEIGEVVWDDPPKREDVPAR